MRRQYIKDPFQYLYMVSLGKRYEERKKPGCKQNKLNAQKLTVLFPGVL